VGADPERGLADVAGCDGDVQRVTRTLDDFQARLVQLERPNVVALQLVKRGQVVESRGRRHLEALLTGKRERLLENRSRPLVVAERPDGPAVRRQPLAELLGESRVP
jgi:hypothetical protein